MYVSYRKKRLRSAAAVASGVPFLWTFTFAAPAYALTHPAPSKPDSSVRKLSSKEMQRIFGAQMSGGGSLQGVMLDTGGSYPWQSSSGGVNTANLNKLISLELFSFTARGGLSAGFSLYQNSLATSSGEIGPKWSETYDISVSFDSSQNASVVWGDGSGYTFTHNVDGSYSPPAGIFESFSVNPNGGYDLITHGQTKYHFAAVGTQTLCTAITDSNGNSLLISHNSAGQVSQIADPSGRKITLTYNSSGDLSTVADPAGATWTLNYASSSGGINPPANTLTGPGGGGTTAGDLISVAWPLLSGQTTASTVQFAYNSSNDITSETDRDGHTTTLTYTSGNGIATETDPMGLTTSYSTPISGETVITDPNGHTTTDNYDSNGRLISEKDALGNVTSYAYDSSNDRTAVTDAMGHTWNYTYDTHGNCLTSTDPLGDKWQCTYDAYNNELTSTNPLGDETVNTYNTGDDLLTTTDPLGNKTSYSYDSSGDRLTTTDPLGKITTYGYDSYGDTTSITDADGHTTTASYDIMGMPLSATDALNHTSTISYDAWERKVSAVDAAGDTTKITYDANGNTLTVTDPNGNITSMTYDADGRVTKEVKGNGDTETYLYDGTGQKGLLSSWTDGNGHTTSYQYDADNQKTAIGYPDGTSESFTYNADGQTASHTDQMGQTITFAYDADSRQASETFPSNSGAGSGVTWAYDAAGQLASMTDVTGMTSYSYDADGRLTARVTPEGSVDTGYNADSEKVSMTSGSQVWSYGYDPAGLRTAETDPFSHSTSFTYDAANRLVEQVNGDGTMVEKAYDSVNRPTDIWHYTSTSGSLIAHYGYTYDSDGNVVMQTDADGTITSYTYDGSNQLTGEMRGSGSGSNGYTESFTYDHNENRLTEDCNVGGTQVDSTYTYDNHDHLLTAGTKHYAYNADGDCTSVTNGSAVTTLKYDILNRVTGITLPTGAVESYAYNGNWQRVSENNNGSGQNELYAGSSAGSPLLEDSSATYTPGLSEERGGKDYTYHADAAGSTRGITSGGAVTDAVLYDAFGNTISRSGSTPTPVLYNGAAGYQSDSATGLQLLGHRYYDPSIGRFLSSDPAQAGTNWYAYCDNNPLIRDDSSGLSWWKNLLKVLICLPTDAIIEVGGLGPEDPAADVGCYAADVKIAEAVDGLGESGAEGAGGDAAGGGTSSTGSNTGGTTGSDTGGNSSSSGSAGGSGSGNTSQPPGSSIANKPRFIAATYGPAVEIPSDSEGTVAANGKGSVWQPPGQTGNSNSIRIMDPTERYPNGYVRIYNGANQPIDGIGGNPGPNSVTHLPLNWS